jgi:NADPH-dependent curcumin reductase CurA
MSKRWVLQRRPSGLPVDADFAWTEYAAPTPGDGEVLVETMYLSVDPYQRYMMDERPRFGLSPGAIQDLMPSIPLGEPIVGGVVGRVIESQSNRFARGDLVEGYMAWQTHNLVPGEELRIIPAGPRSPSLALHVLGMTGLTAYIGVMEIGRPRPGETVFVSSAAGAVGGIAGQIARIAGCRTVGTAGSEEKAAYCVGELGYDAAVNYRGPDAEAKIDDACPDGVDVYFDNVGGAFADSMIRRMNVGGRIVCCGAVATYNDAHDEQGPRIYWPVIAKRLRVEGFLVEDHVAAYDRALVALAGWLDSGELRYREHMVHGLDQAPAAFRALLEGDWIGKVVVAA